MARPSKIDRIAPELREELGRRREGGATLDELLEWLRHNDVEIGRTAVWRHLKALETTARAIRSGRQRAEALMAKLGDVSRHDAVAGINRETLQSLIMSILAQYAGEVGAKMTSRDAQLLADALAKLAQTARLNDERERAIRLNEASRAAREATGAAQREGLSPATIERIRAAVLGLSPPLASAPNTSHDK